MGTGEAGVTLYQIRVRDDAGGYYKDHRGERMGRPREDFEEAEEIRRACPNGHEFEVVEVDE